MKITWNIPGHSSHGAIDPHILLTFLPTDRISGDGGVTYGDYVEGLESLLLGDDARAVRSLLDASGRVGDLESVHIDILKHGHFYHPARMAFTLVSGEEVLFVVNLAVGPQAIACAEQEFGVFKRVDSRSKALPVMYGLEEVVQGGHRLVMLMGEWLEGFYEFHQTHTLEGDRVVMWSDPKHIQLSLDESFSVYRQSAEVLTRLYNPTTFESVQPWHHAAGDFVVSMATGAPVVRLITIRQYTPMVELDEVEPEDYLEGTLFFLMSLSLRNRLDRYDGIGDVAWVGKGGVEATFEGFMEGLSDCCDIGPFEGEFSDWVLRYLALRDEEDLLDTAMGVVASFNPEASEMVCIKEMLIAHVSRMYAVIQSRAS